MAEQKRIKIGVIFDRKNRLQDNAQKACNIINENIIPTLKDLHLSIPANEVLAKWVQNVNVFENSIANKLRKSEGVDDVTNRILHEMLFNEINKRVDDAMSGRRYNGCSCYADEIKIEEGVAVVDMETITEKATYYLTTKEEIRAYHRHEKAVQALNEFFEGKACDLRNYFTIINGEVKMRTMANYFMFNEEKAEI